MNTDKDNFEGLFDSFKDQWDTEKPASGHQQRFLKKLEDSSKTRRKAFRYRLAIPFAAAILVLLGMYITYEPKAATDNEIATISPQVKETQMYFASIIEKELAKVEKEDSPETKVLIQDALIRMEALEKDYEKLTQELLTKGENKALIHAMITNLQTRISFLEEVLEQIENIKKLKETYNENKTI